MCDHPTEEGVIPPRAENNDKDKDLRQAQIPKTYRSQDRYHRRARAYTRQDESVIAAQRAELMEAYARTQEDTVRPEGILDTTTPSPSNPQRSSARKEIDSDTLACLEESKAEESSNLDKFNLSPSHSICDMKAQMKHSNVEGDSFPQFGEESKLDAESERLGNESNRRRYIQAQGPLVSEEQSSGITSTQVHTMASSPFLYKGSPLGFTTTGDAFQAPSPFFPNTHSNRGDVFHEGRHFDGYSQPTGLADARRETVARSLLDHNSEIASSKGNQLSIYQRRDLAQPSTRIADRFANPQVELGRSQNYPAPSHPTAQYGYQPAYLRYAPEQNEQLHEDRSRDAPAPTTPRDPVEIGQRFEVAGPRDYSALLNTPRQPFKASPDLQPPTPQYGEERSHSAQGFYSPTPYSQRPLPPLPPSARWAKEEKRRKNLGESSRESIAGQLRKAKSNVFGVPKENPTSYQQRSFTPDGSHSREPPPVAPAASGLRTVVSHSTNTASGIDYLTSISEQATATSAAIGGFLKQRRLESMLKSLSKSNVQDMIDQFKILDHKIDWLGDSLWKGSSDARRLFVDQNTESIKLVYYQMLRTLTHLSYDLELVARTKGQQRCVKNTRTEMLALIKAIRRHLDILVRSMEPYVGTAIIGNQRAGKGEILITRYIRCEQEWIDLKKSSYDAVLDSNPQNHTIPRFV